jgi:colicin import membrane protein
MNTDTETKWEIVPDTLGLESNLKLTLEQQFSSFFAEADKWRLAAQDIEDPKEARAVRLQMKNLRVAVEKKHKEMKADSLLFGRAVDGAKNIFLSIAQPIERQLEDIEKAEERRIQAEKEAKQEERRSAIVDYLDPMIPVPDFSNLTDEQFAIVLNDSKALFEMKQESIRKAEQDRIEREKKEAEEREAQRLENIRLKAEAEAREKEMQKEREKLAKEKAETEKKVAAERAEAEKKAKAEAEARAKLQAEAENAKAEAERIKREAEEKERKAKQAEESRLKADAEEKAKREAAPDKEKIIEFSKFIESIQTPNAVSENGKKVCEEIKQKTKNFAKWILTQAAEL